MNNEKIKLRMENGQTIELVYARNREKVQADIEMLNPHVRGPRPR